MEPPDPLLEKDDRDIPPGIESFRVMGVNTIKLLKRIEEEGEDVWLDEYSPPNRHSH